MTDLPVIDSTRFEPLENPFDPARGVSRRPSISFSKDAWLRFKKNKQALVAAGVLVFIFLFTFLGPVFWTQNPSEQDLSRISVGPNFGDHAIVVGVPEPFQEKIILKQSPQKKTESERLGAVGVPSQNSIRFEWAPRWGASGYQIYRQSLSANSGVGLGVPIGDVDGSEKVSFEDGFGVEPGFYRYSVVPVREGNPIDGIQTVEILVPRTIDLEVAKSMHLNVREGERIALKPHPLGTDQLGRDVLARLMLGARISLFIGLVAPLFALLVGVLIGGVAGFWGGSVDLWLMRFTDFILALPFLLFMILFKVALGLAPGESGVFPMLVAMISLSWTSPARLVRGQVLQLREGEFVSAARILGASQWRILWKHLLPNTLGVLLVSLTFAIPSAIFTEAFLSFIGMGVVPPTPSWGSMCNEGVQRFLTRPHEFLFPALMISFTVLAFNLLGDGLRDALDPKLRSVS